MDQGLPCRECLGKFGPGPVCGVCTQLQRFRDYLHSTRCPGLIAPQIVNRISELQRSVLEDAEGYWSSLPKTPAVGPIEHHPSTAPKRLASPRASGEAGRKGMEEEKRGAEPVSSPTASGGAGIRAEGSERLTEVKQEPEEEKEERSVDRQEETSERSRRRKHRHHRPREVSYSPRRDRCRDSGRRKRSKSSPSRERSQGKERKQRDRSRSERVRRGPVPPPGPPPGPSTRRFQSLRRRSLHHDPGGKGLYQQVENVLTLDPVQILEKK